MRISGIETEEVFSLHLLDFFNSEHVALFESNFTILINQIFGKNHARETIVNAKFFFDLESSGLSDIIMFFIEELLTKHAAGGFVGVRFTGADLLEDIADSGVSSFLSTSCGLDRILVKSIVEIGVVVSEQS